MKSFEEFIESQKTVSDSAAKKYVVAKTVANQINNLMGLDNPDDNNRKGFVGIAADD